MKNKFSPLVQKYFDHWIKQDTWDSFHPLDMHRFYQFVKAYKRYSKKRFSSSDIERAIEKSVLSRRPDFNRDELSRLAEEFSKKFETIMEYEKTPFPNVMIEMSNPFAVSEHLRSKLNSKEEPFYTETQIEDILRKNFGKNWRKRYIKRYVGEFVSNNRK